MQKITDIGIDALSQSLGSYLCVSLLNRGPRNNANILGIRMTVAQSAGLTSGAIAVADHLLIKEIAKPYAPDWAQRYIDSGNFVGKSVLQGVGPVTVLQFAGMPFDGIGDRVALGAQTLVGSLVGGMVADKFVKPLLEKNYE